MNRPLAKELETVGRQPAIGTRREDDLYTWVREQAALLREGRLDVVDAANVAEELEDVAGREYDKLESALAVLLMHMLKWDFQHERVSRSWESTIEEQRRRYHKILAKNPGLKSCLSEILDEAYPDGRARAAIQTDLPRSLFPDSCPYSWDDILARPFEMDRKP